MKPKKNCELCDGPFKGVVRHIDDMDVCQDCYDCANADIEGRL